MVKYLGRNQEVLDVDPEPVGTLHTRAGFCVQDEESRASTTEQHRWVEQLA